jgi:predicted transcriptional regulator
MSRPPANPGALLGRELSAAVVLFHEAIAERLGLSATEWKCMDLLARSGPVTAKQLAEGCGLSTGGVTGVVDRLEKAGYVRRQPNPEDRRSVLVHPRRLPEINAKVGPIFASLGQAMFRVHSRYSPQQIELIMGYLAAVTEVLREQTRALRGTAAQR